MDLYLKGLVAKGLGSVVFPLVVQLPSQTYALPVGEGNISPADGEVGNVIAIL
jgi:hypothetical protein